MLVRFKKIGWSRSKINMDRYLDILTFFIIFANLINTNMAHPKRKISKTRRDKRRTHYKADTNVVSICPTTGVSHVYHRAYTHEGKLYYKGKLVSE